MRTERRRILRKVIWGLLILVVAGWLVPSFFNAERYRKRLQTQLEELLHRPVTFGGIQVRLIPRPGFSIENVTVSEDPAFGSEPFAHVGRIECDLKWRSLWGRHLDIARLDLEDASLNVVRNEQRQWNVKQLLMQSGVASPVGQAAKSHDSPGDLIVEVDNARVNFKVGADKKPFAISHLNAHLDFDPARHLLRYHLAGEPVRTDISLPSPGLVELDGEWAPGNNLNGPLQATLRAEGTMLYDWVPLLSGRNPDLYGVLDTQVKVSGSARLLKVTGVCHLTQLRRWEEIPSSNSPTLTVRFRGDFDRNRGEAIVEGVDASFANSQVHMTGSISRVQDSPRLDLVVAVEHSRLEDFMALTRLLSGKRSKFGLDGRVDGLMMVQGAWTDRRYGGFLTARDVHLRTPSRTFPVSEAALRIDRRGIRLEPVKVFLGRHANLIAQGSLELRKTRRHKGAAGRYHVQISAKELPLRSLIHFARALGYRQVKNLDASGTGTGSLELKGWAWPFTRPKLVGRVDLRLAQLFVPGLAESLNLLHAHLEIRGDQIIANPVVASLSTTVFKGRIAHQGNREEPWEFNLKTSDLNMDQAAQWFEVASEHDSLPIPFLEHFPRLFSLSARKRAGWSLLTALNARGLFSCGSVSYRGLVLKHFRSSVAISRRVVRLAGARFQVGGGQGQGKAQIRLNTKTPSISADLALVGVRLAALAPHLPPALRKIQGSMSGTGEFETSGISREQMRDSLRGTMRVDLKGLYLGSFDPLESIARRAGWGPLEPARVRTAIDIAPASLRIADQHLILEPWTVEIAGAQLSLKGNYRFGGPAKLDVHADLSHLRRHLQDDDLMSDSNVRTVDFRLSGPIDKLAVMPEMLVFRGAK